MPETTGTPREEQKHSGLMAGLEIVEAETPPEAEPEEPPEEPREHPPEPDPTVEHALAPIQAMWDGAKAPSPPPAPAATHPTTVDKPPRRLPVVLPGLLVLALLAACVSWVTAAPLWLAVGRGLDGTVTVKTCDFSGCRGDFRPDSGDSSVGGVRVTGEDAAKRVGATSRAQVTSHDALTAYAGDRAGLWWRVGAGTVLLLGCGFGVAAVSGAWRWHGRVRVRAVATSLAAPLALFAAVLGLAW